MAVHLRLRCAFQFADNDPKNQAVINPCFRVNGVFVDANQLCNDLASALSTWVIAGMGTGQITVKSYDIEGTKPVYPNGSKVLGAGTYPMPNCDSAQALCFSFYGQQNVPRMRGRLYLPAYLLSSTSASLAAPRASGTIQSKAMALGPILASLGGANVDWIVWSGTTHSAHTVSDYWVDDGWDHVRSRALKASGRLKATTSG
jgi:hypothetical protein